MLVWDKLKVEIYEKWHKWWFEIHPPHIAEYSWNYLFTGGKEIRPKLFCELWHYLSPDLKINGELAFAIECIHIASIILDDTNWMDNAKERRGKPTLHIKFSPKIALLITNNVITMAVEIWKNNKPNHISDTIWKSLLISKLQRLTAGQLLDLEQKGNLIELASLKTGVLFEFVTETVALCLELDTDFWRIWGNNLGILFQWVDDYLDINEDLIQNNRNAFNESHDITLKNYTNIWKKIEKEIGPQWFERPFGHFMKTYFLENITINNDFNNYHSISEICIPNTINFIISEIQFESYEGEDENCNYFKHFMTGLSRKNIISRIYKISENVFSISATKSDDWNSNELYS
jgi:hypothetical protein